MKKSKSKPARDVQWWTCTFCWKHWRGSKASECPRGCKPLKSSKLIVLEGGDDHAKR